MAKASLNNGQTLYGVNDLFIGPKTHSSARYLIRSGEASEAQSSSGVIVSTGMGSTGWLKSLLTGSARPLPDDLVRNRRPASAGAGTPSRPMELSR